MVMYGCESWTIKESWAPKNWCFWTVVLEKTLESPLDYKEIQPVHPKGDQSRVFLGRTDVEAETPILWPPDAKSWLIWKDPDAGRDWRREEKGMTEDQMVGWHHRLNGHGLGELQSWWWTGRPGVLQFMVSQRVGHDWTEQIQCGKSLKYCGDYQNVTQGHKMSKCCWKNDTNRLVQCKVATNLQFVKTKAGLQSAIKWGMPVLEWL